MRVGLLPRGWIRVKVTDAAGTLIPEPRVSLFHQVKTRDGSNQTVGNEMLPEFHKGADPRGQYRIAVAADGTRWEARAKVGTELFSADVVAPDRAGAEVTAVIVIPEDRPLIRGAVATPAGEPISHARLAVVLVRSTEGQKAESVDPFERFILGYRDPCPAITDARGRFWVPLDIEDIGDHLDAVELRVVSLAGPSTAARGRARVDQRIAARALDIGVVTLEPRPLVCDGRLQIDGRPITDLDGACAVFTVENRQAGSPDRWQRADGLAFVRDEGGWFEVRGTAPAGRLRLGWMAAWSLMPGAHEFRPGDRDLQIQLRRCGSLTVSVLLPPADASPTNLGFAFATGSASSTPLLLDRSQFSPNPQGARASYTFRCVAPGKHTLEIRLENEPEPILQIEDVLVSGDGQVQDPRLANVDLRGLVRATSFKVFGSHGLPSRAYPRWLCKGKEGWVLLDGWQGTFLHREPTLDLCMVIRGRRPRFVKATGGAVRIDLPETEVDELRFQHTVAALPGGVRAWVEVRSAQGSGNAPPTTGTIVDPARLAMPEPVKQSFGADGEARVVWPAGFPHEYRFFLGRGTRLVPCVAKIESRDGVVVLTVSAAERDRALDRL